ncbi:hypothetical protein [Halomonas sp. SpR8]|uniref:hypothetical protein n=1 Tax=Halomonas sp. SpR8 TaxID=3050463 RepID=UPI0027E41478|nr:hypothetical protein [Halomonas sp. SpR8]MDQ7727757.1 hypothetical protein [Halomonas sp. SpR8]
MTLMAPYQDRWVTTSSGRMFTRIWEPLQATALPPILLWHDSLGCVELWRSFPEALCAATSRV